ncbi:unnamed protein product [Rotaria magnacalcarata]|uniref:Uncharacterized protein n=1 Tax=Rotaria magnacalcarata TaxID=392030 RepID=A0A819XEQ3_9BILA|nr:unnamed protein product [Rotaria magnacalcarata]CAF2273961.1 unnamed protein product [Rotaria magnacalcarata]CAF4134859.1 unnamed protein product [Rotaria magnacalcarata]CAF4451255.1 unnamed protein product [Rotaria magnacalcarata]CAF4685868.1 unnamed protein product [Rotaria magnacalcarata]
MTPTILTNDNNKSTSTTYHTLYYEFGRRNLLDVYNVLLLKLCLSTRRIFLANLRTGCFTLESINKDSENMIMIGVRTHIVDTNHITLIDYVKVYGKTKEEYSMPEICQMRALLNSPANTSITTSSPINQYLHSFRETSDEKQLARFPLPHRFIINFHFQ